MLSASGRGLISPKSGTDKGSVASDFANEVDRSRSLDWPKNTHSNS